MILFTTIMLLSLCAAVVVAPWWVPLLVNAYKSIDFEVGAIIVRGNDSPWGERYEILEVNRGWVKAEREGGNPSNYNRYLFIELIKEANNYRVVQEAPKKEQEEECLSDSPEEQA